MHTIHIQAADKQDAICAEDALTQRIASVKLTPESAARLRAQATARRVPMGRVISELVMERLPPAPPIVEIVGPEAIA
jgi:hypothetical protein